MFEKKPAEKETSQFFLPNFFFFLFSVLESLDKQHKSSLPWTYKMLRALTKGIEQPNSKLLQRHLKLLCSVFPMMSLGQNEESSHKKTNLKLGLVRTENCTQQFHVNVAQKSSMMKRANRAVLVCVSRNLTTQIRNKKSKAKTKKTFVSPRTTSFLPLSSA